MAKEYSISAVVLSRNSEKKIGKCLESLKGWADEIIVVDGESTDNTVKIAEVSNAKVYSHKFLGAFSAERNFGSDRASGDWVLQLDSDEIVSEDLKKRCDETLPKTHQNAFKFRRKNVFLGHEFKYGGWYHWSQHLFRKGSAHYEGRVHEKMVVDGEVGYLDADILHIPFDSISEFIERQNRYTDLQARDIIDTEKDLTAKKIRYNLKVKPLKLFKKIYFNKKGYKEGIYGLVFALLSSWVHFLKWAKVWELVKDKKNILVIRNDRFGEFLLNVPAMRALKEKFTDSKIILAVDPYVKGLAVKIFCSGEVIEWKKGKHSLMDILKFVNMLKRKEIDVAFVMNPSKDSNIAIRLAGIPERIGYARKWDFLLTKKIEDLKHLGQKHEVEYNLDLVKLVGVSDRHCEEARSADCFVPPLAGLATGSAIFRNENEIASLPLTSLEVARNDKGEFFGNAIAIHPWTSDPIKQWPPERFRELALKLVKELEADVLIIGGKDEMERSNSYNYLNNRIRNMTGKTSLVELAALLKRCRMLISGDSGPVHLACAVGTPVIALFRDDIPGKGPKRWGPWGEGNVVIAKKGLSDISVEEVFAAICRAGFPAKRDPACAVSEGGETCPTK